MQPVLHDADVPDTILCFRCGLFLAILIVLSHEPSMSAGNAGFGGQPLRHCVQNVKISRPTLLSGRGRNCTLLDYDVL